MNSDPYFRTVGPVENCSELFVTYISNMGSITSRNVERFEHIVVLKQAQWSLAVFHLKITFYEETENRGRNRFLYR